MTAKRQALEDLLQGFLKKFGNTLENKLIISDEIDLFIKKKQKITIKDLDDLEEILLYKLNPTKKFMRRASLSPICRDPLPYPSPTLIKIKPDLTQSSMRSQSNSSHFTQPVPIKQARRKDSLIFPTAQIPESLYSKTSKIEGSPVTSKALNDQWGKIFKAEGLKFKQEQINSIKKGRVLKKEYWEDLEKQVKEKNDKKAKVLLEREHDGLALGQQINDYFHQITKEKLKKNQKMVQQKKIYDSALEEKLKKKQLQAESLIKDKESIEKNLNLNEFELKTTSELKNKKNKEIEEENLASALQKKELKKELKLQDSQKDLIHLMQIEKNLKEEENRFKDLIKEKADFAHNEERMLRFFKVQKTLKDYEEEANETERLVILKSIKEEEEVKIKKKLEKMKQKEEVSLVLQAQLKESFDRKKEDKNYLSEQGEIWKQEDLQVKELMEKQQVVKKEAQKEIKFILDQQVKEKQNLKNKELSLTQAESRINSEIYTSAVKILGE